MLLRYVDTLGFLESCVQKPNIRDNARRCNVPPSGRIAPSRRTPVSLCRVKEVKIGFPVCRFFLPPIILYAGLSVRKKAFFKNALTIASTGILGTYIAFAVIAILLYSIRKAVDIKLSVHLLYPFLPIISSINDARHPGLNFY